MHLQALLLDIDGTLVDSNEKHADCWVEAFQHFGRPVERRQIREQIGKGGDLLVPDTLDAREMRRFGKELREYRAELWKRRYIDSVRPLPGAVEAVRDLHRLGLRLALASSAQPEEVEHYVRLLGVEGILEGTTSTEDVKFSKPSPEIFQAALEQTGCDPLHTAAVGDTPYDILAAHRIPLPVIAVLSGGFPADSLRKAEFLLDDLPAVVKEIERIDEYFRE